MNNNKKIMTDSFIIIIIISIALMGFFITIIMREKLYIINNGKEFEAKCIDKYIKGSRSSHHRQITVYVFEVTFPNSIKGEKFKKSNSKYNVGRIYKGKYIVNEKKSNKLHKKYEYQIVE